MPPKGTGGPYKNGTRYWGDFRSYADVEGDREPLIEAGEKLATRDAGVARHLYDMRRQELQLKRAGGVTAGKSILPLSYLLNEWLPRLEQQKRNKRGQRADEPLKKRDAEAVKKSRHAIRTCLTQPATQYVPTLRALGTSEMTEMIRQLLGTPSKTGGLVSPQTVRRHLMELSAMFERARFDSYMGANPLDNHPDIPAQSRGSALDPEGYLTRDEVKQLLEEMVPNPKSPWAVEQAYVLFYTGCRLDELNGILVRDVDFNDQIIHILDYEHRTVKSKYSRRQVPLWPKLAAVLQDSLKRTPRPADGLLFPRAGSRADQSLERQMMTRIRKSLKSAAVRAGIAKPAGHHVARHSYISMRRDMVEKTPLGTDVPVSNSVIVREVGHATDDLIQSTYGHLSRSRIRQTILDYGDAPVNFSQRVQRGRDLVSAAVKAGIAKAQEAHRREAAEAVPMAKAKRTKSPASSGTHKPPADPKAGAAGGGSVRKKKAV
jgi:integrase